MRAIATLKFLTIMNGAAGVICIFCDIRHGIVFVLTACLTGIMALTWSSR